MFFITCFKRSFSVFKKEDEKLRPDSKQYKKYSFVFMKEKKRNVSF